ncbi:serine/threonine-protein phosphatase 6 regulatory ankyrin repeat subunit B isoform X2 [Patella vulgata]|nr:serine/threonine-protein phosphatase 6 regulatory ankyrin repeat subunit B isoform X2 [Patella vulgata]
MDKTNEPRDDRTVKRDIPKESDDEMEHLLPTKKAKLSIESEDIKQKHKFQTIQERLTQTVDDVNIDQIETILKELQPDDVRRLQDVIISLTCQSLERRYLPLVKFLFNNIIILQSDGQLDINLNIQLMTCAIKSDFVEGIQYLYKRALYLEVKHDDKVWSALLESVKYDSFNITKYLLTVSDINLNPGLDKTILMFAKSGKMLSILLSNDQIKNMINYKSKSGFTALYHCTENIDDVAECLNCIKILTEAGGAFDKFNLLHVIYKYGGKETCLDIITLLIKHGADVNMVEQLNSTPLTCAIEYHGDKGKICLDIIKLLIQNGADVNKVDGYRKSPLTCAIEHHRKCSHIIELLIGRGANVNMTDELHASPLTRAIEHHGDKDTGEYIITLLIRKGADVNMVDGYGRTPLARAITYHSDKGTICLDIIKLLIQNDADVKKVDGYGMPPLTCAIEHHGDKDTGIIALLINHGADVNMIYKSYSPLIQAILQHGGKYPCKEVITLLIQKGAVVNMVDKYGRSPLTCAIEQHGDKDMCIYIMDLLIKYGADVNMVDRIRGLPLTRVIEHVGDKDTGISLLIQHGADVNMVSRYGTPLTHAIDYHGAKYLCKGIISLLIHHGADVNMVGRLNTTPLTCAISRHGDKNTGLGIITLLIKKDADVNKVDGYGMSPLACAITLHGDKGKCVGIIKLLIQNGADPAMSAKLRPLMYAAQYAHDLDIIKLVLVDSVNVNKTNEQGLSACRHCFVKTNKNEYGRTWVSKRDFRTTLAIFKLLVESGADLVANGPELMYDIINFGQLKIFEYYIGLKPSVDSFTETTNQNIFHRLAKLKGKFRSQKFKWLFNYTIDINHKNAVKRLLETGGNIDSQDINGKTALILAAMNTNTIIMHLLLELGSELNILETKYETSALHFLDLDNSRYCLKTCIMRGGHKLLNLPGPDGNTLIQRALLFPTFYEPEKTLDLIRYFVAENCCLQHLQSVSTERNYYNHDVFLDDFNSEERNELRQLLYRSGAPEEEVVSTVNFKMEDELNDRGGMVHLNNREKFKFACFNLSLEAKCIRVIRQKLGLGIKEKVEQLLFPKPLIRKILLVDLLSKKYFGRYSMDDYYDSDDDDDDDYDVDSDDDDYGDDDDDDDVKDANDTDSDVSEDDDEKDSDVSDGDDKMDGEG